MARFTIDTSGGRFKVIDTDHAGHVVLDMPFADLHFNGSGATVQPTITHELVDRAFGTPYGPQREMGFDVIFTYTNTDTVAKQVGVMRLGQMNLVEPVEAVSAFGDAVAPIAADTNNRQYPGDVYSPLAIIRDRLDPDDNQNPYNICVALAYPVLDYDHPVYFRSFAAHVGAVPTEIQFDVRRANPTTVWYTIGPGETRVYRLICRINDRTDTKVGPAADAPDEWLWTLRGYQQYFRRLYGKPDYRRMGGWDGRVVGTFNSSTNLSPTPTNPRRFENNPDTNGGTPATDGYFKFTTEVLKFKGAPPTGRNVDRAIIWALSGFNPQPPPSPYTEGNYDPRFATGVTTLVDRGPVTVRPALRAIRDRMQIGLYWGRSTRVPESNDWANLSRHEFDPDVPADVTRLFNETDLAVRLWQAQVIGLDAFGLGFMNPGKGYRWLRALQKRYPHVLFVTEKALPDALHTIAPTYEIEAAQSVLGPFVSSPFWVPLYINPGSESFLQIQSFPLGSSFPVRASQLSAMGFTVIGGFQTAMNPRTIACPRWKEIGERPVPDFDRARFPILSS